jgi:hypothetical protein
MSIVQMFQATVWQFQVRYHYRMDSQHSDALQYFEINRSLTFLDSGIFRC